MTETLPTPEVPANPVTGTLAIAVTVTEPNPDVALNPVTLTSALAVAVTVPTEAVEPGTEASLPHVVAPHPPAELFHPV